MKPISSYYLIMLAVALSFTACKKDNQDTLTPAPATAGANKIAPEGFNFATAKNVTVNLSLKAPNNDALAGVVVSFYDPGNLNEDAAIFKAVTDKSGNLSATISVPSYLTKLVIDPAYLCLVRFASADIAGNSITATLGGKSGYSSNITPLALEANTQTKAVSSTNSNNYKVNTLSGATDFQYPSPYTSTAEAILNTTQYPLSAGRPKYLTTPDVIDAVTLAYLNSTFPDGRGLPSTHPQYFTAGLVNTINVVSTGSVSIGYLTGNTAFNNTIAYYTYPTNNPPQSINDIKNATYLFPNTTNRNSNGMLLQPGDKINLGTFNAGTTIAFVLIQGGWSGTDINVNNTKFWSQNNFNADFNFLNNGKHSVMTYDNGLNRFFIGFENRDSRNFGTYDADYNDCVLYASAAPGVISTTNVALVDKGTDSDGDGVPDAADAFSNDASKAYISYFPSQSGYAQLAFEDNWPQKGDYDMNDVVVNYRYTFVSNANNQVVTMQGDYNVAAAGASFKNGFGVQLPVSASTVQSVTGQKAISNYIQLASNGVESNQSKAVIIPFDNFNALSNNPDGAFFINTLMAKDKVTSTTASVLVTFVSPVNQSNLTVSMLNPFLISNLRRGYEIHLPGYAPTDKADSKLFGTNDDATVISSSKTYLSKDNWPWAISYNGVFNYPIEGVNVSEAYPHFLEWAGSNGTSFTDWYTNTVSGYRNTSFIYTK
jgi:LruC domain-containing protein